jgi:hypothetical protein
VSHRKISIEKVSNGFTVNIIVTGESIFKEPYTKGKYVFESYERLAVFLAEWGEDDDCVALDKAVAAKSGIDKEAFADEGPF